MKKIVFPAALFFLMVVLLAFGSGTSKNPKEISDYRIVDGATRTELENEATYMISSGYLPQGGVSFSEGRYIQAMTR